MTMVGHVIEAVLDILGALACAVVLFTLGRRRGLTSGIAFSVLLLASLFSAFLPVLVPWVTGPTGLGQLVTTVSTVLLFVIDAVGWGLLILAIVRLRAEAPGGPGHAPPPPGPPYGQPPSAQPGQPYGQPGQPNPQPGAEPEARLGPPGGRPQGQAGQPGYPPREDPAGPGWGERFAGPGSEGYGPAYPGAGPAGGQRPGPAGGRLPTHPRKSHVGLVVGLVGGFGVLVLIGGGIVWQHYQASQRRQERQATMAIYERIGWPAGFTEQGSPRLMAPTWLKATWTAPAAQGRLISATAAWLDQHTKTIQVNDDDVRRSFKEGEHPYFFDDQQAQSIEVTLSHTGSTYRITESLFR
jgi:hypothetical protein